MHGVGGNAAVMSLGLSCRQGPGRTDRARGWVGRRFCVFIAVDRELGRFNVLNGDGDDATGPCLSTPFAGCTEGESGLKNRQTTTPRRCGWVILVEQLDLDGFIADHSVEGACAGDAKSIGIQGPWPPVAGRINPARELGLVKACNGSRLEETLAQWSPPTRACQCLGAGCLCRASRPCDLVDIKGPFDGECLAGRPLASMARPETATNQR